MRLVTLGFAGSAAAAAAFPAWAHHSHAMYDNTTQITLNGTLKELQWSNPHVVLYMVVRDKDGQVSSWALEGGSPAQLLTQGWPQGNVKPGDAISVTIRPLKGGARGGLLRTITFADKTQFIYGGGPDSSLRNNRPRE